MDLQVPFFVYWLIVKEYLLDLDFCDGRAGQFGYCLSNFQCSNIVNGTVIGSCSREAVFDSSTSETVIDSSTTESSRHVCCYKTLSYYNETYAMQPLFNDFIHPNTPDRIRILNEWAYTMHPTIYSNNPIPSNTTLEVVEYDEQIHTCVPPDRIIWPITPSLSREIEGKKPGRMTSRSIDLIYLIAFDKVYDEEKRNLAVECLSNLNASQSEVYESRESNIIKYYIKFNAEEKFRLRKFFTQKLQYSESIPYTDYLKSLFDDENPQEFRRRSLYSETLKDKNGEKINLVNSDEKNKEVDTNLASRSEL